MIVYVIRHAAAAERGALGSDAERPLTKEGVARMKTVAGALCAIGATPSVIYTSPLVRARQTADIFAKALTGDRPIKECEVLRPGHSPAEVVEFLAKECAGDVAVVGHEPQLGDLVALMVTGRTKEVVDMKKASACCVEFDNRPAAGKGHIVWHLVPGIIERLVGQ
jgi:phosphohistidine phosphatase